MAVAYQIFTSIIEKLKEEVPILTQEDIITTLDIIYMSCAGYNDVADSINYITVYYKKQYKELDTELFKKKLHDCFDFLDQENLDILKNLIDFISINNVFNHPLLLFNYSEFINEINISINFIQKKVKIINQENIDFIKKITLYTNLNALNKLKQQLNNNLEILRHFKSIFEKQEINLLPAYNFVATQIQYLRNGDKDHKNAVTLTNNEYQKIKKIVIKDSRFKDVIITVNNNDEILYQLNTKELHKLLKMEIIDLLNEYQTKSFNFKGNKTRDFQIKIKGLKLKIQNCLDLSKMIFEVLHKPVEFSPLTKLINGWFHDMKIDNYLNEIEKTTDDSIEVIEKLNKKLQEILGNNDVSKKESLVQIKDMSTDDKVNTKKIKVKTRKKKNNKNVNNSKIINNMSEANNSEPSTSKTSPFSAEDVATSNPTLEEQKVDMKKQAIGWIDSVRETGSEDQSLKTKINELETQLKQTQEELNKVKFSLTEETSLLSQQLIVEQQKVQILSGETQLLLSKISDLENEKQKLENIKDQNSKKIDSFSKNLAKEQKKVKNVRDQKKQSIEKLREKKEALLSEKKQLLKENKKSSQQLEKLNQELVKARDALMTAETKNQKLVAEVNKLKTEKIKLEISKANNDIQIKAKEENISLLEKKLATTTNKESSREVQKLLRQKDKLIAEKEQLLQKNKKSSQQLVILISRLNQKVQALSQLKVYNRNLATFIDNYEIIPCTQVTPIVKKRLVSGTAVIDEMMEVIKPVPVLVPTGKQVLVPTETWEDIYITDELTQGFWLQAKPWTM